ncbi:hypothetical protein VFPFJ_01949 [Purpureocillium lilacinum]|uniref:Uncharacterized protein n=1 Tax=Purpureocillium lilacinum TaxID=33203 RepID=A0A179HTA9_PURLI|nr:hypothetical protein VFPFJ_01949 [Purpureocillium lilacinum]OAQ92788.1 hypothetical protein VFPFJ_01949 [Purpureocillium lilacinum]
MELHCRCGGAALKELVWSYQDRHMPLARLSFGIMIWGLSQRHHHHPAQLRG